MKMLKLFLTRQVYQKGFKHRININNIFFWTNFKDEVIVSFYCEKSFVNENLEYVKISNLTECIFSYDLLCDEAKKHTEKYPEIYEALKIQLWNDSIIRGLKDVNIEQ